MYSKYVCADCGRTYQSQESLTRHRRNHDERVVYECGTCRATFKRKDLLNRHTRVHTNPRHRTQRACQSCTSLKLGCDTRDPCSRCISSGRPCVYKATKFGPLSSREAVQPAAGAEEQRYHTIGKHTTTLNTDEQRALSYDGPSPEDAGPVPLQRPNAAEIIEPDVVQYRADHSFDYLSALLSATSHTSMFDNNVATLEREHVASGVDELARPLDIPRSTHDKLQQLHLAQDATTISMPATTQHLGQTLATSPQEDLGTASSLREAVEKLINEALVLSSKPNHQLDRTAFWSKAAGNIKTAFKMRGKSSAIHVLDYFLALYFQHFHTKWPVIWKRGVVRDNLPPHLYLVMTTIGAAYSEAAAVIYSEEMLKALGTRLLQCCFEQYSTQEEILSLTQSLVLLQAALLYFGQADAFLFCHRISTLWIPICHEFDLFDETQDSYEMTREDFIISETRRRLGMACLHIDTLVSGLLGFRPLLRFDELRLRLPVPDHIWLSEDVDDLEAYQRYHSIDDRSRLLSSSIRSALDPDDSLPQLPPEQLELLFHGVLHYIWSILIPSETRVSGRRGANLSKDIEAQGELSDAVRALRRGRRLLNKISTNTYTIPDRTSLLTSTYLHGIGAIWLNADIQSIYRLARGCCSRIRISPSSSASIDAYNWANSEAALIAIDAACYHWGRTADELTVSEEIRADFTVIAHAALLYSALVIWVVTHCRRDGLTSRLDKYSTSTTRSRKENLTLRQGNAERLLKSFADLLLVVQRTQQTTRPTFAIFHIFTTTLSTTPFPLPW